MYNILKKVCKREEGVANPLGLNVGPSLILYNVQLLHLRLIFPICYSEI